MSKPMMVWIPEHHKYPKRLTQLACVLLLLLSYVASTLATPGTHG